MRKLMKESTRIDTVGFVLVGIVSCRKKAFRFMSLTAHALDWAIRPNRWMLAVVPPNVLSASSLVAVFPSKAFFFSSPQWHHEYSDPDIDRYLYVAFFSSCSSVHMASAAVLNEMKGKIFGWVNQYSSDESPQLRLSWQWRKLLSEVMIANDASFPNHQSKTFHL